MYLNKPDLGAYIDTNNKTPIIKYLKEHFKKYFYMFIIGGNNNHSSNDKYYLITLIYSYYVYLFM